MWCYFYFWRMIPCKADTVFSGIVEEIGRLVSKRGDGHSQRLTIGAKSVMQSLSPGDSIAVDGVCLTVEERNVNDFSAFASPESLSRTTISLRKVGDPLNLERSLQPTGRLSGHFVLGHVDGMGEVAEIKRESGSLRFFFRIPDTLLPFCVEKGSIAIDGISLTIASLLEEQGLISIAVIPYTLERTTLSVRKKGDRVNVETDIFAKYAMRFLEPYMHNDKAGLTEDLLRSAGFMS